VPTEEFAKAARRAVHETTILQAQGKMGRIADVVLMKSGPCDVVGAVELSHATLRKMHQIAALAMSGSSALVAINALMLKRTKLAGITRRSSDQTSQLQPADSMA
jgi:Cu2+-exporting ATPase